MKHSLSTPLLVAAAVCVISGCSDPADKVPKAAAAGAGISASPAPADKVPKASASDPKKAGSGASSSGKEYVVRAESTIGFVASKVTRSHNGGFKNFAWKINVAGGRIVGAPEFKISMQST